MRVGTAPVFQTGNQSTSQISDMTRTEPFGLLVNLTTTAAMATFAPITCGLTTGNMNQQQDAGSLLSALATQLTTCSMEERSNGSAIPTLNTPAMV